MDDSIRQLQASVDAEQSARDCATAAEGGGGMELIYAAAAKAAGGGGGGGEGGMEGSTLYVGNLTPPLCSMTPLHEHFKRFGEVVNMKVVPEKRYAFVQMGNRSQAVAALDCQDPVGGEARVSLKWANYDIAAPKQAKPPPRPKPQRFTGGSNKLQVAGDRKVIMPGGGGGSSGTAAEDEAEAGAPAAPPVPGAAAAAAAAAAVRKAAVQEQKDKLREQKAKLIQVSA
tara:strand:+ start:59 stop:742 length:684 start_codon:yes stop_codon:yes gene_type:complete